jgi:Mg/Co/Ni transporter MgtE
MTSSMIHATNLTPPGVTTLLIGGRCGEILEKVAARNRWDAGKILSAMNRPKAAAILTAMALDRRAFMLESMDHFAASLIKVRMDSSLVSDILTRMEVKGALEGTAGDAAGVGVHTWSLEKGMTSVRNTRNEAGEAHKAHTAAKAAEIIKAGERRNKINSLISQADWRENQMQHAREQEKIVKQHKQP